MVARRRKIKTNLSAIFQFISSPNQLNTFLFLVFGSQWFNLFSPSHKTHTLTHKTLPSLSSSSSSLFSLSLSSPSSFFVANLSSFPLFSHFFPRRLRDRHETFRLTSFSHTLLLIHTHTLTYLIVCTLLRQLNSLTLPIFLSYIFSPSVLNNYSLIAK